MGVISWVLQLHSGCSLQPIDNICSKKKKNTVNLNCPSSFSTDYTLTQISLRSEIDKMAEVKQTQANTEPVFWAFQVTYYS